MTEQEKQILIKVLCVGLPYETKVEVCIKDKNIKCIDCVKYNTIGTYIGLLDEEKFSVKPYLRPLTSMTEEERNEYLNIKMQEAERVALAEIYRPEAISEIMDWLDSHHLDYRGLIPMGLALPAPEGMYNIKTE